MTGFLRKQYYDLSRPCVFCQTSQNTPVFSTHLGLPAEAKDRPQTQGSAVPLLHWLNVYDSPKFSVFWPGLFVASRP